METRSNCSLGICAKLIKNKTCCFESYIHDKMEKLYQNDLMKSFICLKTMSKVLHYYWLVWIDLKSIYMALLA